MTSIVKNKWLWCLWLAATLLAGLAFASVMYVSGDRSTLLIGQTTGAHHQIELACEACHTSSFYATEKKVNKNFNKACLSCHKDELNASNDSHPIKKFRDPRNIARREILDALYCVTCHVEHKPEITTVSAVTVPMDYCVACHQDVAEERPSHTDLGFETCASAGCHNYHDNTALYEKFLVKHADAPDLLDVAVNPFTQKARSPHPLQLALASANPMLTLGRQLAQSDESKDRTAIEEEAKQIINNVLEASDALAPPAKLTPDVVQEWSQSLHAQSGVNCTGCHLPVSISEEQSADPTVLQTVWIESPGPDSCVACHKEQVRTFTRGKHGMRTHDKLPPGRSIEDHVAGDTLWAGLAFSLLPDKTLKPMHVSEALLPMKVDAQHLEVGSCSSCHAAHQPDLQKAAGDACMTCHDDQHTNNYPLSAHFALWQSELSGEAEAGSGVSCADCHMPKIKSRKSPGYFTTHNQNDYLRPNEKMIRPVCQSCHGLSFSIDALADPLLVEDNFSRSPASHIKSIDWALGALKSSSSK